MESERPPQILLEISPRRLAGTGPLLRLAAALAFADVLAHSATPSLIKRLVMKWSGAAPCQCHSPPGADDLAEQTRERERCVVLMGGISGERHLHANVARFG